MCCRAARLAQSMSRQQFHSLAFPAYENGFSLVNCSKRPRMELGRFRRNNQE
jgi:hypothetical protein